MEFPVAFIERPRLYGDRVTFLVRWEDRSVTEEEVSNLIPIVCSYSIRNSSINCTEPGIKFEDTIADKLRERILSYF